MLIRFTASNFLSFDQEVEFNMIAGSFKTHKHHLHDVGKIKVLQSAAIYGANGAGKSNLVKAMEFLQDLVLEGHINHDINAKKFKLNPKSELIPTSLEIEFSIGKKIFVYGVSIDGSIIVEEWLFESLVTSAAKMIFERNTNAEGKHKISIAPKYSRTKKAKLLIELMEENLLQKNELLLGKTDSLKIDQLNSVRNWIMKGLVIIHPQSKFEMLLPAITMMDDFRSFVSNLLQTLDTGLHGLRVDNLDFEKYFGEEASEIKKKIAKDLQENKDAIIQIDSEKGPVVVTKQDGRIKINSVVGIHRDKDGNDVAFPLAIESDGTQRLLDFIPALQRVVEEQQTFVIDEIDQSIHPTLLLRLVKKVTDDREKKGQFIFTTHESCLLDLKLFRPDEIWFVEKDRLRGCSQLYSLSEFKPRYDLDIRRGYLKGRFGAIPFMSDLEDLNWHQHGI